MVRGAGTTGRINKDEAGGGGGTVTAADNGLSLSGTIVQLGGPLIQNTDIDIGPWPFNMREGVNALFTLDFLSGIYALGDQVNIANGTFFRINDGLQQAAIQSNGRPYLLLDKTNDIYQLGDITTSNNGTFSTLDDNAQTTSIGSGGFNMLNFDFLNGNYFLGAIGNGNQTVFGITDSNSTAFISSQAGVMLDLSRSTGFYQIGDITGINNGTHIIIDDNNKIVDTAAGGIVNGLLVDLNNLNFSFGDFAPAGNKTNITITDSARLITTNVSGLNQGLTIDFQNNIYSIGDFFAGPTYITVIGPFSQIEMFAPAGVGINGLPTLSPFHIAGLANFANNAAAVAGGLGVGDFYRISVAGTSTVAVVQ